MERARDCVGVGAGHLGKTNKIYILLEILLDAGVLSFARAALAFAFLAVPCALCRVRVFFLAVCLVYSLCVSLCLCIWCPAPAAAPCTISFSTQSFVLLPRGQDEQDFVTYKPNNKLETRLAAVVKVGFDNKITFTVVALLSAE